MSDEIRVSNDELPETWSRCEIGEISPVVGGGTPPSKDPANFVMPPGGTPWITPADLSRYREIYISHGSRNLTTKGCANSAAKMLPKGALLFSSRAPVGYVAIASNPVCTNQGFKSFVLPQGFDSRFGYFYLRHIKPVAEAMATGTTFKELSGAAAAKLPFVIAPLAEQKRIADKLEAVLGRVDACRARLDHVPALLKRFRQSVLASATSGGLTAEWRVTNGVNDEWQEVSLGEIADVQGGVTKDSKKQSSADEEVPYLRVANVQRGYINLTEIKTIRIPPNRLPSLLLKKGDVLFNEGGDLDKLGRGWIWEEQISRCSYQNHVFRARLHNPEDQPKYISWWGNYRGLEYFIRSGKQTTNLASINKSMLCNLPISLPTPAEQAEIVRRVEELFTFADRIEARLATTQKAVERLTPATLAKAFRGELVPQDPNDEPASALLERLSTSTPIVPAKSRRTLKRRAAKP